MNDLEKCGVCGKKMSDGVTTLIGTKISFVNRTNNPHFAELVNHQFGAFDPDKEYALCYECWLLSLGFLPEPKQAVGYITCIAARDIRSGELIEYCPSENTKDIITKLTNP